MSNLALLRCANHRDASAGWQCTSCKKNLCGKCIAEEIQRFYCCACDADATQFTKPRAERPLSSIFATALKFPFQRGLWTTIACALALAAIGKIVSVAESTDPWQMAIYGRIIDAGSPAEGALETLDAGSDSVAAAPTVPGAVQDSVTLNDLQRDTLKAKPSTEPRPETHRIRFIGSLLTVLIVFWLAFSSGSRHAWGVEAPKESFRRVGILIGATAIVWLPGVLYLMLLKGGVPDTSMRTDWAVWLYAGLSVVYLPLCIGATVGMSTVSIFNPFQVFAWLWKIKGRYVLMVVSAVIIGGIAAGLATPLINKLEAKVGSMLIRGALGWFAACCVISIVMQLLGSLSFIYGYVFGWGPEQLFVDPVLPDAKAEGVLKRWAAQREALDAKVRQAAEERATGGEERRAIGLAAKKIGTALESGETRDALKIYSERTDWPDDVFRDKDLLGLALAAQRAHDTQLAETLLERLVDKKSFHAARARIALAQILTESGQHARAHSLLRSVVDEFPSTEYARQAEAAMK